MGRRPFRDGPAASRGKPGVGTGAEHRSATFGNRFFAALLAAGRRAAEAAGANWKAAVYEQIEQEIRTGRRLTRRRMCQLGQVSRAGFYRYRQAPEPVDRDMELRDALQRLALEMPSYGWRRITAELRRRGWRVNHKRVRRLMREDNLLCVRRRRFVLTTDSGHPL